MFGRSELSPQKSLELAKAYLGNAHKTEDPELVLMFCDDAEGALSRMKRSARKTLLHSLRDEDRSFREEIGTAYFDHSQLLDKYGRKDKVDTSLEKAKKWSKQVSDPTKSASVSNEGAPMPSPSLDQDTRNCDTATIPPHIFAENKQPPTMAFKMPEPDERLNDTPQLAYCIGMLKAWHSSPGNITEPVIRDWLRAVENDEEEKDRLRKLVTDLIRAFANDELKDAKAVAEVVCLAPILEKDSFRDLLRQLFSGVEHSSLLDFYQLEGLAQVIQNAAPDYLEPADLVKILEHLSDRLRHTNMQSMRQIYQLTLAVSNVLDAMADAGVKGLDLYQAAYAYQALQCIPDDETLWQGTLRRTGKVIQGVAGIASAVKALDLNGFIKGLGDIQQGLTGVPKVFHLAVTAYKDVTSLSQSGQSLLKSLKEGFSFERKQAWYPALRGADALLRDGRFADFKKLVCEAPCRRDPAFQWGVCQRLGALAANSVWDSETRQDAVAFLGELYRNDAVWGQQVNVKQWIVDILMQLATLPGSVKQSAEAMLQQLESDGDVTKQALYQACRGVGPGSYPLKIVLPSMAIKSLLDQVQNAPDVEVGLRQLRKQRLRDQGNAVYIEPQAKASFQASDDSRFHLMDKVKEFLDSDLKVFLLLGDSGAGKSTFNRVLEHNLWYDYKKKDGYIPLYINLPAIHKPEHDLLAKQLRRTEFTEFQIRELKFHRKFILICDGYDESQQTHNLYTSNRLNQAGEWIAKMIISCRSEYIGLDYRDRFQPADYNHQSQSGLFQQAVIAPFSEGQVNDYINRYVSEHRPTCPAKHYLQALEQIPSLKDLVKNPFLLSLSLE
ncbi:hypothetical protein BGZ65_005702, partial [Modicella reniformis]